MRGARDRSAEIALGVALAATLMAGAIHPTLTDVLGGLTGAVVASGTSIGNHHENRVMLLGVTGNRRTEPARRPRYSAYHVLFVNSNPQVPEARWWSAPNETRYNALLRSVKIGGQRYWLRNGNLFVARFGDDGSLRVTQLRSTVVSYSISTEVESAFVDATRGDAELQRMLRDSHFGPR